jgi:hypothetical protein
MLVGSVDIISIGACPLGLSPLATVTGEEPLQLADDS